MRLDGAIFDITERRAAEEALRAREIEAARTEEIRASSARIVAAADAARRKIERDPAAPDWLLTVWGTGYKAADV